MKEFSTFIKPLQFFTLLLAIFLPAHAYAHPGMHHPHDWLDGVMHILTEIDHLVVIIAVVALFLFIRRVRRKSK